VNIEVAEMPPDDGQEGFLILDIGLSVYNILVILIFD
jgi:hypothetical protein